MKNRKVMLFESWDQSRIFSALLENVSGEIKDVEMDVEKIMGELKDEGKDAESDEVKAALLMQAIELADEGKDLEDLDVDAAKKQIEEGFTIRGKSFNDLNESGDISESAGGVIHGLELIGNVLGNSGLLEFIAHQIEKATGKKPDMGKIGKTIEGIAGALKKVTGLPAKAIAKFFEWIAGKFGLEGDVKKGAGLVGKLAVIIFLFGLGVAHFPVLGTGVLWWILSLTGLVGKSIEVTEISQKIFKLIKGAGEGKNDKAEEELGVGQDEIEKLAAA